MFETYIDKVLMKGTDFVCALCGTNEYFAFVSGEMVDGADSHRKVVGCECAKCTVRFGDPKKFKM